MPQQQKMIPKIDNYPYDILLFSSNSWISIDLRLFIFVIPSTP